MATIKQRDKRSGITYVYESTSYWDREKKQPLILIVDECHFLAEGILRDWKEAGVKTFADIAAQDSERSAEKARGDAPENRAAAGRRRGQKATRFDNFEGHGYDYDEMVWNMISRDAGGNDGTE